MVDLSRCTSVDVARDHCDDATDVLEECTEPQYESLFLKFHDDNKNGEITTNKWNSPSTRSWPCFATAGSLTGLAWSWTLSPSAHRTRLIREEKRKVVPRIPLLTCLGVIFSFRVARLDGRAALDGDVIQPLMAICLITEHWLTYERSFVSVRSKMEHSQPLELQFFFFLASTDNPREVEMELHIQSFDGVPVTHQFPFGNKTISYPCVYYFPFISLPTFSVCTEFGILYDTISWKGCTLASLDASCEISFWSSDISLREFSISSWGV